MIPKLRAWDTHEEVMNRVDYVDFVNGVIGMSNENVRDYEQPIHRVNIMQSTGLKDAKGVEIFEGDVVRNRWANEYTPVFQNGIYMAYNPKHLVQSDPSTQFNIVWKGGCEIIGNVYENPELLEEVPHGKLE